MPAVPEVAVGPLEVVLPEGVVVVVATGSVAVVPAIPEATAGLLEAVPEGGIVVVAAGPVGVFVMPEVTAEPLLEVAPEVVVVVTVVPAGLIVSSVVEAVPGEVGSVLEIGAGTSTMTLSNCAVQVMSPVGISKFSFAQSESDSEGSQPTKVEPASGIAMSVTVAPLAGNSHIIALVVPLPAPTRTTVTLPGTSSL